jgi:hypothetical protein
MPIIGGRQIGVRGLGFQGAGKPTAPTITSVSVASTSSVTVNYTLGASNGAPITAITVLSSPSTSLSYASGDLDGSVTVTGTFTGGQAYTFTMTSTNAVGVSDASAASNSVTPELSPYWLSTFKLGATRTFGTQPWDVDVDSSGNTYVASLTISESNVYTGFATAKYDSKGSIQWAKNLKVGSNTTEARQIGVDGSGNVYTSGYWYRPSPAKGIPMFAKYDSSGTLQWQRQLIGDGLEGYDPYMSIDSSGNIYMAITMNSGGTPSAAVVMKYDTSGNKLWENTFGFGSTPQFRADALTIDSSGNVYVACGFDGGTGAWRTAVVKYNSSGTLQFQRFINSTGINSSQAIGVDPLGNIYLFARDTTAYQALVFQLSSTGTLNWQKKLTTPASGGIALVRDVAFDSSNNAYLTIRVNNSITSTVNNFIVKYNSSGTLQWQRYIGSGNGNTYGIKWNAGEVYGITDINGELGLNYSVPDDGSKTGTYTVSGKSIVYASGNLTETTPTYSVATPTIPNTSGTTYFPPTAGTGTDSSLSLITSTLGI